MPPVKLWVEREEVIQHRQRGAVERRDLRPAAADRRRSMAAGPVAGRIGADADAAGEALGEGEEAVQQRRRRRR